MGLRYWTNEEESILAERWPNETPEAISADMNRSPENVKKHAAKLGLPAHKTGRRAGSHLSEASRQSYAEKRLERAEIRSGRGKHITRDPFIAVLFGACEAIKATALPSRVFRQSMDVSEELEAAA